MLDIRFVRENPDKVKENIKKKFQMEKLPLVDEVIELDKKIRNLKQEGDSLRQERNNISSMIGSLMRDKKIDEANEAKKKVVTINEKIPKIEEEEAELEISLKEKMMVIPNIIDDSVPVGKDDSENVEVERFGEPFVPNYEIPYHADICDKLNGLECRSY